LDLKLSPDVAGLAAKLHGKAKPIAATMSAVIAVTAAIVTFISGSAAVDELAAANNANWNGPVGLLDADYAHLVMVGKISGANRQDEYAAGAGEVRDPMVAPAGVLKTTRTQPETEAPARVVTTLPSMWLSGIIWDPQNPVAMIDGLDLHVGDRIKGARVVEIRTDSVVLSFASKQYVLTVD
jgi:hypothetical protein